MAKFRVIKGGSILLGAAVVVLIAVLAVVLISVFGGSDEKSGSIQVFSGTSALIPAPYAAENEHTDSIAAVPGDIVSRVLPVSNNKRILIYHTHTHEAYQMASDGEYEALEMWRTDDNEHNIVRVGDELAALLEDAGFEVTHDVTDHELNDLSTAYVRSLETLMTYEDTEYDLYIDLHRDAYVEGTPLTCSYSGKDAANLMVLIGSGENFEEKPYFDENYELACELTDEINAICPGLCRNVMVKTGRYNQHIAPNSLLIEVGSNMNTLSQALAAMPALADAISEVLDEEQSDARVVTVSYDVK